VYAAPPAQLCPAHKLAAKPVAKPLAKPQVARIPVGGLATGDGSTARPKTLPFTGVSIWPLLAVALGCFVLGGLLLVIGARLSKRLPLNDTGAISLPVLRRTAALVAAVILGSAGTFLAVAQATHRPVTPLVQAVFTPSTELDPATSLPLLPVHLTGSDLPAGAVIRVRTAAGTAENCTHSKGFGVSTDGVAATSDGWKCASVPGAARFFDCATLPYDTTLLVHTATGPVELCAAPGKVA
jgi:hypothetical protein